MVLEENLRVSHGETEDEKPSKLVQTPQSNPDYSNSSNSQKTFSFDEYCRIIDHAELLRELDKRKESPQARSKLEELGFDSIKVNRVLESRVYEFAGEMGIPKQYVDKAIENISVSDEQMLSNLKDIDAKISRNDIIEFYKQMFLRDLERKFPTENFKGEIRSNFFDDGNDCLKIYKVSDKIVKKRFYLKPWKKYIAIKKVLEPLASIAFIDNCQTSNWVYSPIFLSACSKTFDKLNKLFKRENYTHYYYRIDLTKVPEINSFL